MRSLALALSIVLAVWLCAGCDKVSAPTKPEPQPAAKPPAEQSATSPASPAASAQPQTATDEQAAKGLFETRCSKCHPLAKVEAYDEEKSWEAIVGIMAKKTGADISAEDSKTIVAYLEKVHPLK